MAWCPLINAECRSDCAWFVESRRKYTDHVEGTCAKNAAKELRQIKEGLDKLNTTLYNKEF